ncbi:Holliday junction resolvase RecU [Lentilactobacillus laojiaonis]|uniref:Holliday junction resolvase RecU n=1 Tax=Lentilactobacillus laojiaonis TaxID=2883998 RepID=UPI001D0B54CD|nr:Holliday junction resolvase RecU [Lentilactobacillus laojiaonis]UDM32727.1 Holliday junction resolvase RecU [Lentilactobacillus laojiaonis]
MTIKYPNGKSFIQNDSNPPKIHNHNSINYAKRGMSLESEINDSNQYYLQNNIAVIHKKPTPIRIVSVDYPKRSAAKIKEAYFQQASTTDYNGVYNGKYIDFDAKETKNKTSFPLSNFHEHQIEHMRKCLAQGGICFAIIKFTLDNTIFVLDASILIDYWDKQNIINERKSIPKNDLFKKAIQIDYQINPIIPYLDGVDILINQLKKEK